MRVKRNTLLLIACLVWSVAGFNIFRIGFLAYPGYVTLWNLLLSVVVFGVFQKFVFGKLVVKHTARIKSYLEERQFFLKFFDGNVPEQFIAVFYSGLGASLFLAGILFGRNYGKAVLSAADSGK